MTLGNMRRNGVRGLFVTCQHCVHYAKVDAWPDDVLRAHDAANRWKLQLILPRAKFRNRMVANG